MRILTSVSILAVFAVATVSTTSVASAQSGTNCTAPTNVFGGSGIPTANAMCGGVNGVNMYLGVSPRYTSPAPTTAGDGIWSAQPGNSTGGAINAGFATWNFNFASTNAEQTDFFALTITGMGVSPFIIPLTANYFDSSNLGYFGLAFDNTASQTYTFRLDQYSARSPLTSLAYVEEVVNVGVVPEPSTYVLLAAGLAALGFMARRRKLSSF